MYEKILLAVDGSENALRATDEAIKIAKLVDHSHTDIVLVADFAKAKQEVLHANRKTELDLIRRKKILPATEKFKAENLAYDATILHGDPGSTIVKHANEGNYDLLVIGSRGLSKFKEFVLGSVSNEVVKKVNCPVLVVK